MPGFAFGRERSVEQFHPETGEFNRKLPVNETVHE